MTNHSIKGEKQLIVSVIQEYRKIIIIIVCIPKVKLGDWLAIRICFCEQ